MGTRKIIAIRRIWLLNLNPDSWTGFGESSESSLDVDSLAKLEVLSSYTNITSVNKQQWRHTRPRPQIQTVRFASESESRFTMKLNLDSVKSNTARGCVTRVHCHIQHDITRSFNHNCKTAGVHEKCWTGKLKTNMLKSIGKQSGESVESVQ